MSREDLPAFFSSQRPCELRTQVLPPLLRQSLKRGQAGHFDGPKESNPVKNADSSAERAEHVNSSPTASRT